MEIQFLPGIRIKVLNRHSTYGRVEKKSFNFFWGSIDSVTQLRGTPGTGAFHRLILFTISTDSFHYFLLVPASAELKTAQNRLFVPMLGTIFQNTS